MRTKKAGILTKLIILALILYGVITLFDLRARIEAAEAEKVRLQEEVDELTRSNAAMEYEIDNSDDPDTIEAVARKKLGLVMPGEKIFYNIGG